MAKVPGRRRMTQQEIRDHFRDSGLEKAVLDGALTPTVKEDAVVEYTQGPHVGKYHSRLTLWFDATKSRRVIEHHLVELDGVTRVTHPDPKWLAVIYYY
ncbi:hypothetical protein [Luteitalea sp.]